MRGIGREVAHLVRVLGEVEEQRRQRREVDVLPALVADRREVALLHAQAERALRIARDHLAEVELVVGLAPRARRARAAAVRQQRFAVAARRRLEPERLEDRRHDVDRLGEVVDDGAARGVAGAPGTRTISGMWYEASK